MDMAEDEIIAEEEMNMPVKEEYLLEWLSTAQHFVIQNGWFLLVAVLLCYFVWSRLRLKWYDYQEKMQNQRSAAAYHRNPDQVFARQSAIEASRRKLQDEYNVAAQLKAERMKELEEERRKEKVADWERHQEGRGYRSRYKPEEPTPPSSDEKKFKPKVNPNREYSPLMGDQDAPTCSFRPGRQGGSRG